MKIIKKLMLLFMAIAFLNACQEETILLPESAEMPAKTLGKENLGSIIEEHTPITQWLFALYPWSYSEKYEEGLYDIAVYNYNVNNDDLSFIQKQRISSNFFEKFGFDFNKQDGQVYLLAEEFYDGDQSGDLGIRSNPRNLYVSNFENGNFEFFDEIVSYNGNTKPYDLTFGKNGTLYFVFQSGEINAYNLATKVISPVANVPQNVAVGLTYDFDNNRLIYVTGDSPIELYTIDLATNNVSLMFSFSAPSNDSEYEGEGYGTAQAIEYVGNNKCIVSSTYGADIIYTLNLASNTVELLASPTGSFQNIKDFMYISSDRDNDGFSDNEDEHPDSNLSETITIGECNTNVANVMVGNGTFMADQVDDLIAEVWSKVGSSRSYRPQSDFTWKMYMLTSQWQYSRLITRTERYAIMRCVYGSNLFVAR